MSALRNSVLPAVLLLALVIKSPTPAAGQGPGIWVYLKGQTWTDPAQTMTVTLINLTDYLLLITENNLDTYNSKLIEERWQSYPFQGLNTLLLSPYRTATWKSYEPWGGDGDAAWDGQMAVLPNNMTLPPGGGMGPEWTVYLNCRSEQPAKLSQVGKGTWINLIASENPGWGNIVSSTYYPPEWRYGIWSTMVPCVTPSGGDMWNVYTLSGTKLAVSLYSPDNRNLTMVFRQTFWNQNTQTIDDYIGWKLDFVDNDSDTVPE